MRIVPVRAVANAVVGAAFLLIATAASASAQGTIVGRVTATGSAAQTKAAMAASVEIATPRVHVVLQAVAVPLTEMMTTAAGDIGHIEPGHNTSPLSGARGTGL